MKSSLTRRGVLAAASVAATLVGYSPLVEADIGEASTAEELWLAVALNGQLTGTTALVRYDRAGKLWVAPEDLKACPLPVPDESADTSLAGTALYPLQAFDGLAFKVDEESQTLTIDAPAHLFERTQIDVSAQDRSRVTTPAPGGFFNYDV